MATSRDVARVAGVSQATVSRVLSGDGAVRPATRERVMAAVEAVGYTLNAAAQSMRTGRSNTIGVVVADVENPFYPQLLGALTTQFDARGLRTAVWVSDGERNDAALQAIRQGTVDGVVFTTVTERSREFRDALDRGSPLVLVNRTVADIPADQVVSDNVRGAGLVAEHFVAHGRRPAFIGGAADASTSAERLAGYRAGLAAAGVALPDAATLRGTYTRDSGFASARRLYEQGGPAPDAIFCSNDILAFGAMDGVRSLGLRVPEDVWIVGYDDVDMAAWDAFDLTTVRQDTARMAEEAARLLALRIDDRARAPERVVLPPALVVRGSTGRASAVEPGRDLRAE